MRQEILSTLSAFAHTWDGSFGTIETVKYLIVINNPDARPVHSDPYRAGPAARQIQKEEIDKMTKMGVIEPLQIEWE